MRLQVVFRYIGMVLLFESAFMLLSALISYYNGIDSGFAPLLLSFIFTSLLGGFPLIFVGKSSSLSSKESYAIVIGAWLTSCVVGTFPFLLWGGEFSIINAWFESVSGFTATGASILNDIEALPKGLLFWRSITHWIGGVGVVMFALVIMPMVGRSRMTVSNLEISSMARDNYRYSSATIIKILLGVYLAMTIANLVALRLAGMDLFDATCHAFSTVATGGFSTKNASIGHYNSVWIEGITIFFMLLSSIHLGITYATFMGRRNNIFRTEGSKFFLATTLLMCLMLSFSLWHNGNYASLGESLRHGIFQGVSIVTSTGFATADTNIWPALCICILVYMSVQGGMAGSTAGGLKSDRILMAGKVIKAQLRQQQHPGAIIHIKNDGIVQSPSVVNFAILYIVIYAFIILLGTIFNAACGLDTLTSFTASVASMGNIGPGFGEVGSLCNFSEMPVMVKLFSTLQMLLGRLEIFGLLHFFTMKWWI
jgi:trk system potassium uptake protein TrkH